MLCREKYRLSGCVHGKTFTKCGISRVLKGVQKKFFAPKKKKKQKIRGVQKIFLHPPKKKKKFLGRKNFFEGVFQAPAGILWLFVSTTTDTAKHHSVAVTLTMCESGAREPPTISQKAQKK